MTAMPLDAHDADAIVVILGAGLAGCQAAETLRDEGFAGNIVLLNGEAATPYDRPPLSKQWLLEPDAQPTALLREQLGVDLRNGCAATMIDTADRRVLCEGGAVIGYDRLVIATGSRVRILPALPPGPRAHYLRTIEDALRLRAALAAGSRLTVVGAGVIGLEVAAAAVQLGCAVTVIEQGMRVMARGACEALSAFVDSRHRSGGVDFRMGAMVEGAEIVETGVRLRLASGETIDSDHVVVGVGVLPNSEVAARAGIETVPQGVVTDALGQTSDPHIFAAGEVAYHHSIRSGQRERQESWTHAQQHGACVARALLGRGRHYALLPYYWSDQFDFGIQVIGKPDGAHNITAGEPASGRFAVFHLEEGALVGASIVGGSSAMRAIRKLVDARARIDPAALAAPGFDFRAAAAAV